MSFGSIAYPHIDCTDRNQPTIEGKNFKVQHLIREHLAYGWSAEELALNHQQLTLGEIYSALAFYSDHRDEIDRSIAASEEEAGRLHNDPRHRRFSRKLKDSQ